MFECLKTMVSPDFPVATTATAIKQQSASTTAAKSKIEKEVSVVIKQRSTSRWHFNLLAPEF
jgi:hypothetical protein